ncbi:MAG: IS66 family insertion sequence element accessory protein TnpB [Gammaproteobacteria bacterium]|nr:IS66 family insertion sequence element accessory protein TnpB [Gammaproteobacteria bacterium]
MFSLTSSHRYYFYSEPTDMRKSFDGLCGLVSGRMQLDPSNGSVYAFINKRRDRIKLLHWEAGGFTLYYKRLEKGTLELPLKDTKSPQISWANLVMIIEGIPLEKHKKRSRFLLKKSA